MLLKLYFGFEFQIAITLKPSDPLCVNASKAFFHRYCIAEQGNWGPSRYPKNVMSDSVKWKPLEEFPSLKYLPFLVWITFLRIEKPNRQTKRL